MSPYVWVVIIVVLVIVVVSLLRRRPAPTGEYRKKEPGLSFGRLDRALQKDDIHREAGEFTIAIDMGEVDYLIETGEYKAAEEKVREELKDAEDKQDTVRIANMMGYLEKIQLAKKRRF